MPGIPPRPPATGASKLVVGNGTLDTPGGGELDLKPTTALRGWDDLSASVGHYMPAKLLLAGQYRRAALSTLARRGRVR